MIAQKDRAAALERIVNTIKERYHYRLYMDSVNQDIGTSGSGNWGHRGVPGQHGGSAKGGGLHNRRDIPHTEKHTSWSKQRDIVAKKHKVSLEEYLQIPVGSKIIFPDGKTGTKKSSGSSYIYPDNRLLDPIALEEIPDSELRIAVPASSNPNLLKEQADFGGYRERMEKAPRYESRETVDKILRETTGKIWNDLDVRHKQAVCAYTGATYKDINGDLRSGTRNSNAELIKEVIEKAELPQDMWLARGIESDGFAKMLGIDPKVMGDVISGKLPASTLVGLRGRDKGFMSAGSTSDAGMMFNVEMHIFAPKGTKGLYVEPVSYNGEGDGPDWDGKSGQEYFGDEFETILQCNTSIQTSRVWVEGENIHVECFVTGQGDSDTE